MNDLDIDETCIDDFEKVEKFYNGLYMEQLQNIYQDLKLTETAVKSYKNTLNA